MKRLAVDLLALLLVPAVSAVVRAMTSTATRPVCFDTTTGPYLM